MPESSSNRREFLKTAAVSAAAATASSSSQADANEKFQPEEFWRERMKAPDDGKKYGWFVDTDRCFGCHGCEVSCKAENDVPLGNYIRQTFYKDVGEQCPISKPIRRAL